MNNWTFDNSEERHRRRLALQRSLEKMEHYSSQRLFFTPNGGCALRGFDDEAGRFESEDSSTGTMTTLEDGDCAGDPSGDVPGGNWRRGRGRGGGDVATSIARPSGTKTRAGDGGGKAASKGWAPPSSLDGDDDDDDGEITKRGRVVLSLLSVIAAVPLIALSFWARSASVSSPPDEGSGAGNGGAAAPSDRQGALLSLILDSNVTSARDLTALGTAPNRALSWLAEEDEWLAWPPNRTDDYSEEARTALERYAMAVIWYAAASDNADIDDPDGAQEHGAAAPLRGGGWMSPSASVCDWRGVSCALVPHRPDRRDDIFAIQSKIVQSEVEAVASLELNNVGWGGWIPSELSALRDLRVLDVGNNDLMGTLPVAIGELRNLEVLRLHGNSLTGSVPESVCALTERKEREIPVISKTLAPIHSSMTASRITFLRELSADCNPEDEPWIRCDCCTHC